MSATPPQGASDEFIRTAFEKLPTGLIVVNDSGTIVVLNREIERQFGYTREELLGQPVEILVPEVSAAGHSKLRAQYAAVPTSRRMGAGRELFGRHKDGRQIPVEIGLSSITTQEGLFVLATIADLRERRHLEDRLRQPHQLEALGSLARGIANDFNDILLDMVDCTERARTRRADRPLALADLDRLVDLAGRGRELVNRILVFTRTTDPPRIETDFAASAHEAIQLLRTRLPSNIEIREALEPSSLRVMADDYELRQIVMNLADNAAQAMQSHGRRSRDTIGADGGRQTLHGGSSRNEGRPAPTPRCVGHGCWDPSGGHRPHLRTLLLHQGTREGHGAGAGRRRPRSSNHWAAPSR
jgi:PAS domain S-box-containing protein